MSEEDVKYERMMLIESKWRSEACRRWCKSWWWWSGERARGRAGRGKRGREGERESARASERERQGLRESEREHERVNESKCESGGEGKEREGERERGRRQPMCVSLFYVNDMGSTGPRGHTVGIPCVYPWP